MSRNARIEEVSDSDSDPEEMDISTLPTSSAGQNVPLNQPMPMARDTAETRAQIKPWATIYPVYFDKTRTRAEGRRVGTELAVENPLAREIAEATRALGLMTALEPGKTHPKDWANPGRVKVKVRGVGGDVNNKHHLYILIAKHLQENPTDSETPLKLPVQGLRQTKVVPPNAPRGWKMGTILPLHSPALTGGGVSENMFKDMMSEMQGQEGGGMPGLPGMPGMPPGMGGMPGMANMPGMLDSATPGGGGGGGGGGKKNKKKGK